MGSRLARALIHVENSFDPAARWHHGTPVLQLFPGSTSDFSSWQAEAGIETCSASAQMGFSAGEEGKVFLRADLIHFRLQKDLKTPQEKKIHLQSIKWH